jgi:hypothetical protein
MMLSPDRRPRWHLQVNPDATAASGVAPDSPRLKRDQSGARRPLGSGRLSTGFQGPATASIAVEVVVVVPATRLLDDAPGYRSAKQDEEH